ncbi:hypothetical protein LOZ58_001468 [Ophidiomyces ophidiicola]|nr:hypothetical protein LOZ65_003904 [Ophidiomyces ophidiicola]KAI1942592.1 hypothetical protein LOZ66_000997 [Ophidiomyces ophidiicola]KAI1964778.1 hypothetical protein LOZ58_001468 [Ophidiomyces ophidiicola]
MVSSASEAEVVFNRANVALARSQRLIASWLPPKSEADIANEKTEDELRKEEDAIFTPVPEKLGLGAPLPDKQADGSWNRLELSSNDKLRKQLLGKNAKTMVSRNSNIKQTKQPNKLQEVPPSDTDEEESRSSLGMRSKKGISRPMKGVDAGKTDTGQVGRATSNKKRTSSYLDEILSSRSKKKKQKRNGD